MAAARNGRTTPRKLQPEVEVSFDPGKLTVGDLIDLEENFGLTLDQLLSMTNGADFRKMGTRTMAALAFLVKRQQDPDFPVSEARNIPLDVLFGLVSNGEPAKPRLAGKGGPIETNPTGGG